MTQPEQRREVPARELSLSAVLALLDGHPALLWETDPELRLVALTGAPSAGVYAYAGRPAAEFFGGIERADLVRRVHAHALAGASERFNFVLNGREFDAHVKPRRGPDGAIDGVIGIALDNTEHRFAERALRFSEYTYRSFVEEAPYAICRSTVGGALLQVNRAMSTMLGYPAEAAAELLLRDLPAIFTPPGTFESFQQKLLDGGSHPVTDASWIRRDGEIIQVEVSGRLARYPAGDISHFDIFAADVTEKKRLEAELGRAQRMQAVGQLAGGIAHDFNNLLTVIGGHVELMLAEPATPEVEARLRELGDAARKAASLTQQLLAFGRRQLLQNRNVNLNEVIAKLVPMLGRLIRENVQLAFVPGDSLGSVRADQNEIERVLVNLAINAQDAMPGGGRLTIATENRRLARRLALQADEIEPGSYVCVTVTDTGIGMDRETQARVFEPFFTTKTPDPGAGLGLSVVYGVVRQSGGYIQIESEPGAGSLFRIYLPQVEGEAPAEQPPSLVQTLPRGSETILIAEDDTPIRMLATGVLKRLGYEVLSAPDGRAALELAESRSLKIDLLLTDVVMPGIGGPELATRLKGAAPAVSIIFMSGYAAHVLSGAELERLNACFLQKPFSMESLAKTVRAVLDASR
jgi:two-component system, cell cycle sensor histidine kinase and response regulator CckA